MLEDSEGNLWLGSFDQGINVIDPKTNKRKLYLTDPSDPALCLWSYTQYSKIANKISGLKFLGYLQRFDKVPKVSLVSF
jgi:hypothetical protein